MRPINKIIIHLVDAKNIATLIADCLNEGLPMVGFHYMIEPNGSVELGRPISMIGNHYTGENASSIGIACIGTTITTEQHKAIDKIIQDLDLKINGNKEVFTVEYNKLKIYK